jgi:hypothetical protein
MHCLRFISQWQWFEFGLDWKSFDGETDCCDYFHSGWLLTDIDVNKWTHLVSGDDWKQTNIH